MRGANQQLDGGRELILASQNSPFLGTLLRKIIHAINTTAKNAAVSPVGQVAPPLPIAGINVQGSYTAASNTLNCTSEILHWTLDHAQEVTRGVHYFTEVDTTPAFNQPHVIAHGPSRTGPFISLPTQDANGATHTYYIRSYAQYPGGETSPKTVFGGKNNPIGIVMGGTSKLSLLPSSGSGTAASSGQQGGQGFGTTVDRPGPQPKRSIVQHG